MKNRVLSLLASISLAAPLALHSLSASAEHETAVVDPATSVLAKSGGEPLPVPETFRSDHLFDQDELAELAALESENAELEQQKAGFFGPRIGTIIIIVIILVLVL